MFSLVGTADRTNHPSQLDALFFAMKEIWKDVPGYEGLYKVNKYGEVVSSKGYKKSSENIVTWVKKVQTGDSHGYLKYDLYKNNKRKTIKVHRIIASVFIDGFYDGCVVDHIDGNTSNNSIPNLRICTLSQNMKNMKLPVNNTSGYKGVSMMKRDNTWRARIASNGIQKTIGYFKTKVEAAEAYDKHALKLHGEFAKTNKMLGLLV